MRGDAGAAARQWQTRSRRRQRQRPKPSAPRKRKRSRRSEQLRDEKARVRRAVGARRCRRRGATRANARDAGVHAPRRIGAGADAAGIGVQTRDRWRPRLLMRCSGDQGTRARNTSDLNERRDHRRNHCCSRGMPRMLRSSTAGRRLQQS